MAALQANIAYLTAAPALSISKRPILPFHVQFLSLNTKPTSSLNLSISSPIKIKRCLFKSYSSAHDFTSTDDLQVPESESNQEQTLSFKTLISVYKQAVVEQDWIAVSDIEARFTAIENEKNVLDDVQTSETENDQEKASLLKTLLRRYKEAILEENSKIVFDIEARIAALENEENLLDDADTSKSESHLEEALSLMTLIDLYKQAILDVDLQTVSEIEARITSIETGNSTLIKKLSESLVELKSMKERYIRLQADFDNFRKRTENERLTIRSDAQGEVIENLFPIVDSFERAKQAIKIETEKEQKVDTSYQGIFKQLEDILRSLKVTAVATVGKPFDPNLHDAIAQEESNEFEEGVIVEEFRSGFLLGERLLRPAMVKVSAGPGPQKAPEATDESTEQPATTDQ
ncbi:hypothetical protein ACFE04_025544 [Oxalis oulophora]